MKVAIALGSNIGDRLAHIQQATNLLAAFCIIVSKASVYESDPVDCPDNSPSFYNTAILLETSLSLAELLKKTQAIEKELGRPDKQDREVNAPRCIDIDLLFAEEEIIETDELIIPHPRLHLRSFVLKPLSDISPETTIPKQTETITELLQAQDDAESLSLVTETW